MVSAVRQKRQSVVKDIAKAQGIRHQWLAEQCGVSEYQFWRIEDGRQAPPEGYYERLAALFHVPVYVLIPAQES